MYIRQNRLPEMRNSIERLGLVGKGIYLTLAQS